MIIKNLNYLKKEKLLAMVDGCFDPIHEGHIEYFKLAKKKSAGMKIVCCCASDRYIKLKHPIFLDQRSRLKILDSIMYLDYVILNNFTTSQIIEKIKPKVYFKGAEWKGRLPIKEIEICKKNDIEVVFINAKLNSSSKIIRDYVKKYKKFRSV